MVVIVFLFYIERIYLQQMRQV